MHTLMAALSTAHYTDGECERSNIIENRTPLTCLFSHNELWTLILENKRKVIFKFPVTTTADNGAQSSESG